jgi:hypothetical protein
MPSRRELLWIALLALLAGFGAWLDSRETPAEAARAKPGQKAASRPAPDRAQAIRNTGTEAAPAFPRLSALRTPAAAVEPGEAFVKKSWYIAPPPPPPVKPPPPPPPPPPTAPPLPYTYLGSYSEGGARLIILVKGDSVLTVKSGDVLEGRYRVGGVVGNQLEIVYLPLDIKQTLNVGPQS